MHVTHPDTGSPWSVCASETIIDHFLSGCSRNADAPLLRFEDGLTISRPQMRDLVERLAGYLEARVSPGDRVAVALSNRAEYMVALIAVVAVRGVVVSVNPDARVHDTGHMLDDARPRLILVESSNRELFETLASNRAYVEDVLCASDAEPDGFTHLGTDVFDLSRSQALRSDMTAIFYTSGSTDLPKGCMVDHEWWLRIVDADLRMNPEGRMCAMCSVPFFYADPAIFMMEILQVGGTLVAMRRFSVSRYWDVVNRFGVTKIHAIASIPVLLLKAPPHPLERSHSVHHATCVAVPPHMHRDLVDRFGFRWIDNYGATESGQMCRMPIAYHDEMIGSGSLGVPSPEVEFRVAGDDGEDAPHGETGEAVVRSPGLFRGYLNRDDATRDALQNGWYHTGDLVRRDDRGFVYFAGRKKDIIRRSGQNISASEVEAVLRLLAEVKDAAVIAVPDDIRGEEVKAYLQLQDGISIDDLPPRSVIDHCAGMLAAYKIPRFLEYRQTDFPRTPSMRVQKLALKAERSDPRFGSWDRDAEMGRPKA